MQWELPHRPSHAPAHRLSKTARSTSSAAHATWIAAGAGWPPRAVKTVVDLLHIWDLYRSNLLQYIRYYDAILCPAAHHTAPPIGVRDNQRFDYTVPFSLTGYPAAVVPVAEDENGLPVAVQIVSHPWREDIVLGPVAGA